MSRTLKDGKTYKKPPKKRHDGDGKRRLLDDLRKKEDPS